MATINLHSEAILKDLLAESGIPALVRLAADSRQGAPTDPPAPPPADDLASIPLAAFATRSLILRVWSSLLDEEVWFVSGETQIKELLTRDVPRGVIYSAQELLSLSTLPGMSVEQLKTIHTAKRLFQGRIIE